MADRAHVARRVRAPSLFAMVLVLACGSSSSTGLPSPEVVGAACVSDADCASWCVHDRHYPGGMCSIHCASDADCPLNTVCVVDAGGLCAVPCGSDEACQEFGRGYVCDGTEHKGASGTPFICRGP